MQYFQIVKLSKLQPNSTVICSLVSDHLLKINQLVICIFYGRLIIINFYFFTHTRAKSCFNSGLMIFSIYTCIYNKGSCNCLHYSFNKF